MPLFTGVGVALVTLFTEDLAVDVPATTELAVRLCGAGVRAVVVAGSTGEAPTLDEAERRALIQALRAAVPADVPVVAGTGAPSARQAVRMTSEAFDAGADACLVLSPPRVADPRPYYEQVAGVGGRLLAYHFPNASAPGIAVEHLFDLPVEGVKDSSGDPARLLRELTEYDGDVYTGSSAILAFAGPLGAAGAVLALANAEPEMCATAFAGDAKAQLALTAAHHTAAGSFPAGIKALTAARWGTPTFARA